ncbi:hypothetical protein [Agromyces sp. NPDC058126]|uniref:DUF3846 domain-containing protein n=1 Tax=Agromyces sp. NPDC058126 TaxID=3346350 RepID=UPI0036DC8235
MRAIHVDANGTVSSCVLDGATLTTLMDGINERLGSDWYDVIGYTDGIDLLVDDEGATGQGGRTKQPFNPVLSTMVQQTGHPAILHGPGLFLGHDADGNPAGLTEQQVAHVMTGWAAASRYDLVTAADLLTH